VVRRTWPTAVPHVYGQRREILEHRYCRNKGINSTVLLVYGRYHDNLKLKPQHSTTAGHLHQSYPIPLFHMLLVPPSSKSRSGAFPKATPYYRHVVLLYHSVVCQGVSSEDNVVPDRWLVFAFGPEGSGDNACLCCPKCCGTLLFVSFERVGDGKWGETVRETSLPLCCVTSDHI
jgi:hypothetical protein